MLEDRGNRLRKEHLRRRIRLVGSGLNNEIIMVRVG